MTSHLHTFHIPVLGIGYSVDTPVKVARFGISSVLSVMDDGLLEQMRAYHCRAQHMPYSPIAEGEDDARARRITAYLDMVNDIVSAQMAAMKQLPPGRGNELDKYYELLPDDAPLKQSYRATMAMPAGAARTAAEAALSDAVRPGDIDVNIMVKVDRLNKDREGHPLPSEYSDALSALRGFALSRLSSSVVLSAGYNPRLCTYMEQFPDFFPGGDGQLRKRVIIKVSDYRSALVQGKILAKKGIWVSEFRIESGLNCGGHAFATEGLLLGPILEEFRANREALAAELYRMCRDAHAAKGIASFARQPQLAVTVQGGIGTADEDRFLRSHYGVNSTGWGSPFLLVPEATNVDEDTLQQLATAQPADYYLSDASPLGVPFNNFRKSSAEEQRKHRAEKGRPGSPCYKKFLAMDTEFTTEPICTASRQYQDLKIKQLQARHLPAAEYEAEYSRIIAKDCLCEGLTVPALLKQHLPPPHRLKAVAICPGPNLAYFSGVHTLADMVGHIYGRMNLLNKVPRPHMFIKELQLYIDYLNKAAKEPAADAKRAKYLASFKANLLAGIGYYRDLSAACDPGLDNDLDDAAAKLERIGLPGAGDP